MTFEQWYADTRDFRLRDFPSKNPDDAELKKLLATVWNAALDAANKQITFTSAGIPMVGMSAVKICFDAVRVTP